MNCCGFEKNITGRFIHDDDDPFDLMLEYNFSEWYEILTNKDHPNGFHFIHTPRSYILEFQSLTENEGSIVNALIASMPNQQCFARLDCVSAKPKKPYRSAQEILDSFRSSDRCRPFLGQKVVIREYKTLCGGEFRCFIHDKTFRAISTEFTLPNRIVEEVKEMVEKITFYTDYVSYCVDFTFDHDCGDKLMLIEINSPVWLFATSGLYDLDEGYDYAILLGTYQPEIIDYPVIRCQDVCDDR